MGPGSHGPQRDRLGRAMSCCRYFETSFQIDSALPSAAEGYGHPAFVRGGSRIGRPASCSRALDTSFSWPGNAAGKAAADPHANSAAKGAKHVDATDRLLAAAVHRIREDQRRLDEMLRRSTRGPGLYPPGDQLWHDNLLDTAHNPEAELLGVEREVEGLEGTETTGPVAQNGGCLLL
mmetsp:Transcript_93885/g.265213  ORF Transcript_93885/g.265213 Transcript_93885/m.265213 type:complete len:178 (+) Transcript_93885:131-664(+)